MYKKHHVHFIGIGGVGMSGIAEVLLNLGYPVSGSDLKRTAVSDRLVKKGAKIYYGHQAPHIGTAEVVVTSSAIKADNPEVVEAKKKKLVLIQRAEMLAELMRLKKYGVAVSGTHGKTTTTSLVSAILTSGGLDPTIIIGGKVNSLRANAKLGKGDFLVAEADESDGSFLKLSPVIAVITNIDREHMEHYQNFTAVKTAYTAFANKVPFYGACIACSDHPVVREIIPQIERRVITYGFNEEADFRATDVTIQEGKMSFTLVVRGKVKQKIILAIPGRHNVLNSLAALAVADELGVSVAKASVALKNFEGIERRCQVLFQNSDYLVIDDYGHHPVEIRATLAALKEKFPTKRLFCLFQPHRYSRTQDLFGELLESFASADVLAVTDIYPAGEAPIEGITSQKLVEALVDIKKRASVFYWPKNNHLVLDWSKKIAPGDLIVSLGAGDVTKLGHDLAQLLFQQKKQKPKKNKKVKQGQSGQLVKKVKRKI